MNPPVFISSTQKLLENWESAFPDARLSVGLPKKFDLFDNSLIFLDFTTLEAVEKEHWLACALDTERKVIALSPTPNEAEGLTVIKAGGVGYGHSYSAANRLREMSLVVNHGGLWLGSDLMKRILHALQGIAPKKPDAGAPSGVDKTAKILSQREQSVAKLVARGATNLEISEMLDIKERTVKAHITSIFYKLKVRNRVELALILNNIPVQQATIENPSKRPAL